MTTETTQPGANAVEAGRGLATLSLAVSEFDRVEAGLAELKRMYENVVFDVSTPAGMDAARAARMDCRTPRYAVANALKSFKAEVNRTKKTQEERAERITEEIVSYEFPIDAQIKAQESKVAAEKAEREKAAVEAAQRVQVAIDALRNAPEQAANKSSGEVDAIRQTVAATEVTLEVFGDRAGEAMQAKTMSMKILGAMFDGAMAIEATAQQLERERAEIEAIRKKEEDDRRAAILKAQADEQAAREREAEANRQAAAKLAAERAAFEKEQAEARAKSEAEDRRLRAERDALEQIARDERMRVENLERAARAEKERVQREAAAKEEAERAAEAAKLLATEERGRHQWRNLLQVCVDGVQLLYAAQTEGESVILAAADANAFVKDAREVIAAAGGTVS